MKSQSESNQTDVIIIGAGPIGIELAIALQRQNVAYCLIEAQQVGQAFTTWPPHTHFFSTPEHVALAGVPVHTVNQQPISGEQRSRNHINWLNRYDARKKTVFTLSPFSPD